MRNVCCQRAFGTRKSTFVSLSLFSLIGQTSTINSRRITTRIGSPIDRRSRASRRTLRPKLFRRRPLNTSRKRVIPISKLHARPQSAALGRGKQERNARHDDDRQTIECSDDVSASGGGKWRREALAQLNTSAFTFCRHKVPPLKPWRRSH